MARTKVRGSYQLNANFVDLLDTPTQYGTASGFLTVVNTAGDALEFKDKNEISPPVVWYNQIWSSDGSTRQYSLTTEPESNSWILTIEGATLSYGAGNDYTISGTTLTIDGDYPLEAGMKIDISYASKDNSASTGQTSISSSPADQQAQGIITTMTVDENSLGFGCLLHIDSDGNLIMADADATSVIPCTMMALESGTGVKNCLLMGFVKNSSWSLTPGNPVYVSTTPGQVTQTAPSVSGDKVQIIGYATSSDTIYFKPDFTDLEIK